MCSREHVADYPPEMEICQLKIIFILWQVQWQILGQVQWQKLAYPCHSAIASYMARILATGTSSVMASTLGAAM